MSEPVVDVPSVAASFAQMMGRAKELVEETPTEEAPYGYTTDPDGTVRPKVRAGRPRRTQKSLDELKQEKEQSAAQAPQEAPAGDRAPTESRSRFKSSKARQDEPKSYPQFREGVIEKGINRLYRKAGKIAKVWDPSVGQALIDITRAEDPDDITVGKAWEEVARTNPRIRKFLLKLIKGGNWGALLWAHMPVLLALFMKYRLGERMPMGNLMEAFLTPDDQDGAPADGSPLDGLLPQDAGQMANLMAMAEQMAANMMGGQRAPNGTGRTPQPPVTVPGEVLDPFAQAVAAKAAANGQPPPNLRQQPKRTTRAKRG